MTDGYGKPSKYEANVQRRQSPGLTQTAQASVSFAPLQSLFGTVSNALLGQMIGVDALAAVSVFFPVMFFLFAFVMGLSTGATVLIGQA